MRTILLIMIGLSSLLTADFTRDANGIVTDTTTGLEWQDDSIIGGEMTWQSAIDHCEALTLGSYEDWRLPNLNELTSLVDNTEYSPSIDGVFQNTASDYYWSSTTYVRLSNDAWYIYFGSGTQSTNHKNFSHYVRCVRAGQ